MYRVFPAKSAKPAEHVGYDRPRVFVHRLRERPVEKRNVCGHIRGDTCRDEHLVDLPDVSVDRSPFQQQSRTRDWLPQVEGCAERPLRLLVEDVRWQFDADHICLVVTNHFFDAVDTLVGVWVVPRSSTVSVICRANVIDS
ncbi:hypothetical protein [Halolamina sediminis]|uniref:hypothetical protein n=1 Tax=Halolamina sediminis TaxID=1480675 RepID=UPI0006B6233F|nr:hypothetical protein [Halolamina sediminis]